jgi:hypothetical protein
MKVEKGSKLFMNWGAMYPTEEVVVTSVSFCEKFAFYNEYDEHGNATENMVLIEDIKPEGELSANGSSIGIFLLNS